MKTLIALGLALAVALGVALWIQTGRLEREQARNESLSGSLAAHRRALDIERQQAREAAVLLARLYDDMEDARTRASARSRALERLSHENQSVRDWRDTPLPSDLARLLERPALRGGAGYRDSLSSGEPVPPAPRQPPDERRPAGGL